MMISLLFVMTLATVTLPHIYSAIEIQVGEMKPKILQLEENERQLQMKLEEKIKATNGLNQLNPELNAAIQQLKQQLLKNHEEKENILKEARSLLSGVPEVEQSQIIRRLHMERWIKVYKYLVPHMKKEIPIKHEDNRFNVTLRLALTSGDNYKPSIKKYRDSIENAKNFMNIYADIINKQLIQWNNAISVYTTKGECPLNNTQFVKLYTNIIEEYYKKQLEKATFIFEESKKMKVLMKKRYEIIVSNLKKMLPNVLFEDEEKDVVRNLLNSTYITVKTIDEKMNDNSLVLQTKEKYSLIKKDIEKATAASKELSNSESCKKYITLLNMDVADVKKNLMKLAYLKKISARDVIENALEADKTD